MKHVDALFRPGGGFFLIAGPCVLEGDALHQDVTKELLQIQDELCPVIFKASFDKANRSRTTGVRGPGLEKGLNMLARVKQMTGLPVLTDIHLPDQARPAAEVCDVLQIPAALCRQTDLICAAANTGRPINLKKGQWVSVGEMEGAVHKVLRASPALDAPAAVTERGTFFGYGDLVVDMRNLVKLRDVCEVPVILDATHSVQRPGAGPLGSSAGDREYIAPLARAAAAVGVDGLYLEVHPEPNAAPSDGACMLPLPELIPLMRQVMAIRDAIQGV